MRQIDSLQQVINTTSVDSVKVKAWTAWDNLIYLSNPALDYAINLKVDSLCEENLAKELSEKERYFFLDAKEGALNNLGLISSDRGLYDDALHYHKASLELSILLNSETGKGRSYNNIGIVFKQLGKYDSAVHYFNESLLIKEKLGDEKNFASTLNNIGGIYREQGNYATAMDAYLRSLEIRERIDDRRGIGATLNNIGNLLDEQGDDKKALSYHFRSLQYDEELGNEKSKAISYENIGKIYMQLQNIDSAFYYFRESVRVRIKIEDRGGLIGAMSSLGICFFKTQQYDSAQYYYEKSIALSLEIKQPGKEAAARENLAKLYSDQGNWRMAIVHAERALEIGKELERVSTLETASNMLMKMYAKQGDYRKAYEMVEVYLEAHKVTSNEQSRQEAFRREYEYNFTKKALADSLENAKQLEIRELEIEARDAELSAKRQAQYALWIGLLFIATFAVFLYRRVQLTRKQRDIIDDQRKVVEQQKGEVDLAYAQLKQKSNEVRDSINYAKRIQGAILPPERLVNTTLPNSFILYKPKDIVAGDFYWLEQTDQGVLFAAADCTGHGVPGAMVSVVCNNALNRSVREYGLTDPASILDKTRALVIDEFSQSEDDVKDGMDIALCRLHQNQLSYAGANNPLWIVRNGEILETKANKQPIGEFHAPQPFQTHHLDLQEGDTIYVFSDGYVDQFGGEKGKKLKAKLFRQLLLSIQDKPMLEQKERIDQAFLKWMGDYEQVDDVCVIGVRV